MLRISTNSALSAAPLGGVTLSISLMTSSPMTGRESNSKAPMSAVSSPLAVPGRWKPRPSTVFEIAGSPALMAGLPAPSS